MKMNLIKAAVSVAVVGLVSSASLASSTFDPFEVKTTTKKTTEKETPAIKPAISPDTLIIPGHSAPTVPSRVAPSSPVKPAAPSPRP